MRSRGHEGGLTQNRDEWHDGLRNVARWAFLWIILLNKEGASMITVPSENSKFENLAQGAEVPM
jgi:hypothetical protein